MAGQFKIEHVATKPRGYRVRSVKRGSHVVRVAFPPGPRKKGAGKVLEILHPKSEHNPHGKCIVTHQVKTNPGELLIFGNPAARHSKGNPSKLERKRATRERASRIRAARLNPEKKKANRRRNASGTETAVKLFQGFHGHDPKDISEKHVSAAVRLDYTALGDLEYLKVLTPMRQTVKFNFEGDGVKLASSPEGKQLYCIGGNQNILSLLDQDSQQKDFIDLGEALEVQYKARKVHGGFRPVSYYHEFGEKTGARPQLMFDKLRRQIFFVGGEYFINIDMPAPGTPLGEVSPGIEN